MDWASRASTGGSGDTSTWTRRRPPARCQRWPVECMSSCPGIRVCTVARATSRGWPPRPMKRHTPPPCVRRPVRGWRRRGEHLPQHDRGDQPSRLSASSRMPMTWSSPPWWSTTPTCCPGPGCVSGASSNADLTAPSPRTLSPPPSTRPTPRLLALTGASNVSGWLPPLETIIAAAHERDVAVLVDAAQLAAHRPSRQRPTTWRGAATRCTRRSAPASSSASRHVHGGRPVPGWWGRR